MKLDEMLLLEKAGLLDDMVRYFRALEDLQYKPVLGHLKHIIDKSIQNNIDWKLMIGLVASESSFRADIVHYNSGSSDYGLFQLNNIWHNQHRGNVRKHIEAGIKHFKWCLKTEKGNVKRALSRYNTGGGDSAAGRRYASYVLGNKSKIDFRVNSQMRTMRLS